MYGTWRTKGFGSSMQVLLLEEFSPNALVAGEDNALLAFTLESICVSTMLCGTQWSIIETR